ncbi:uncharacterized protein [Palaemon carinicauda]|uniref:uncharacterized protein n=1 Tax=Palaemon carinicauda TaxID=392227 RepID=UPI0035B699F2
MNSGSGSGVIVALRIISEISMEPKKKKHIPIGKRDGSVITTEDKETQITTFSRLVTLVTPDVDSPCPSVVGTMVDFTEVGAAAAPLKLLSFTSGEAFAWFQCAEVQFRIKSTTFTPQLWTSLANLPGITLHQKAAYSPSANGMVERFHRTLKTALMSRCKDSNWFIMLPWVLQELRTAPKATLDVSAAEMLYGDPLVIPGEFFRSTTSSDDLQCIRHVVGKFTPCCQTYKPPAKHHIPRDLHSATHVFLHIETSKPPLTTSCSGPYLVIQCSPKAFLLNIRGK